MAVVVKCGTREHALLRPHECAGWLTYGGVVAGASVAVVSCGAHEVVFGVSFLPQGLVAASGYPIERVRILVSRTGNPVAVPCGRRRTWKHRYESPVHRQRAVGARIDSSISREGLLGGLCLWFPGDFLERRWTWSSGFDAYVRLVRDHLWYEEDARRFGAWPVEDAPHGWPLGGTVRSSGSDLGQLAS